MCFREYLSCSIQVNSTDEFNLVQEALLSSKPYYWVHSRKQRITTTPPLYICVIYTTYKSLVRKLYYSEMRMVLSYNDDSKLIKSSIIGIKAIVDNIID